MESRYATVSLTPSTSRNCSDSAPGTTPDLHVAPPSVVTANVPPRPLAQTTRLFTGLTAIRLCVVPLSCGVSVGWRDAACFAAMLRVATARPMPLSPTTNGALPRPTKLPKFPAALPAPKAPAPDGVAVAAPAPATSATATTASDVHLRCMRFPFRSLHVCSKPLPQRDNKDSS